MFRFIRQLRQDMLTRGNFRKYLGYALGEILLVMIGILLALQVNNWNQLRQEKQKERKLLFELKENLISDLENHQIEIEIQIASIKHIKNILRHLELKLPYHDSLQLIKMVYLEGFEINRSAYESLINEGFEKLSSSKLKKQLSKYYDSNVIGRMKIVDRLNNEHRDALENYFWEKRRSYEGDSQYEKFIYNVASEGVFIKNYLDYRITWKNNFIKDILEPNIKEANSLIFLLESEL